MTLDELTIYLAINGATYVATRASKANPFGTPKPVEEVDHPGDAAFLDVYPTWISDDGCRLVFAANRGIDSLDLYTAAKPPN